MLSMFFLAIMGLLAGILTGIIGMASLTLYPVLLAIGVPAISANATITVAQVGAGIGTVLSSLKELHGHWRTATKIAILNAGGGLLGAWLLTKSSSAGFQGMVPWFILMAGILLLWPHSKNEAPHRHSKLLVYFNWLVLFLVGTYNGYFGAAAGLLMIAVLSRIVNNEYVVYNAMRNFASFINNIIASIIFIFQLPIAWHVILPLISGLFIGGYIGPIILRFIPAKVIKLTVGWGAIMLAVYLGYRAYL